MAGSGESNDHVIRCMSSFRVCGNSPGTAESESEPAGCIEITEAGQPNDMIGCLAIFSLAGNTKVFYNIRSEYDGTGNRTGNRTLFYVPLHSFIVLRYLYKSATGCASCTRTETFIHSTALFAFASLTILRNSTVPSYSHVSWFNKWQVPKD